MAKRNPAKVRIRTTTTQTSEYSMTENDILEACIRWVEARNGKPFDAPPDCTLDISSQGLLRGATVKSTTTQVKDTSEGDLMV
jgi:hypothetical protein